MEGGTFDEFLTKVKTQSDKCEFGTLHDRLVKYKIIIGIMNDTVREKLLYEDDMTLDRAAQLCSASEHTSMQLTLIRKDRIQEVSIIHKKYQQKSP